MPGSAGWHTASPARCLALRVLGQGWALRSATSGAHARAERRERGTVREPASSQGCGRGRWGQPQLGISGVCIIRVQCGRKASDPGSLRTPCGQQGHRPGLTPEEEGHGGFGSPGIRPWTATCTERGTPPAPRVWARVPEASPSPTVCRARLGRGQSRSWAQEAVGHRESMPRCGDRPGEDWAPCTLPL